MTDRPRNGSDPPTGPTDPAAPAAAVAAPGTGRAVVRAGLAGAVAGARPARRLSSASPCSICRAAAAPAAHHGAGARCCWRCSGCCCAGCWRSACPTRPTPTGGLNRHPACAIGRWRRLPTARPCPGPTRCGTPTWPARRSRSAGCGSACHARALPRSTGGRCAAGWWWHWWPASGLPGRRRRRGCCADWFHNWPRRPARAPTEVQAWITPPGYTDLAPIFLRPEGGAVSVPAGSHLTVSLSGGSGAPGVVAGWADSGVPAARRQQFPGRQGSDLRRAAGGASRRGGACRLGRDRDGRYGAVRARGPSRRVRRAETPGCRRPGCRGRSRTITA